MRIRFLAASAAILVLAACALARMGAPNRRRPSPSQRRLPPGPTATTSAPPAIRSGPVGAPRGTPSFGDAILRRQHRDQEGHDELRVRGERLLRLLERPGPGRRRFYGLQRRDRDYPCRARARRPSCAARGTAPRCASQWLLFAPTPPRTPRTTRRRTTPAPRTPRTEVRRALWRRRRLPGRKRLRPELRGACLDPNSSDYDCEGGSGDGPDYTGTSRSSATTPMTSTATATARLRVVVPLPLCRRARSTLDQMPLLAATDDLLAGRWRALLSPQRPAGVATCSPNGAPRIGPANGTAPNCSRASHSGLVFPSSPPDSTGTYARVGSRYPSAVISCWDWTNHAPARAHSVGRIMHQRPGSQLDGAQADLAARSLQRCFRSAAGVLRTSSRPHVEPLN